jgi:hypothetical protein
MVGVIGTDSVTRIRRTLVGGIYQDVSTALSPAMFSPADTTPATAEKNEPVVPAPTLYWFNEWPDVIDTDRLTVRGVSYEVFTTPADWRGIGVGGLVVKLRINQLAALAVGRADAEARFTETLTAFTTSTVLDEATGLNTDVETVVYSGVLGSIKFPGMDVSELIQGGQIPAVQSVEVHVAVGATPNAAVNTQWRVTNSLVDPSLVGRTFRTKGLPQAGFVTEHRYAVESVA